MTSTYGPTIPSGYSPPLAVITPDDHAAWILIATALGLSCSLFFSFVRVLVRRLISSGFGWDDYALALATLLGIIQSSIIFGACGKGLGKSTKLLTSEQQDDIARMYYASNLFFILAIGLSKASVVYFLHRISRNKEHRIVFQIAVGLIATWTLGSFFAIALQCDLTEPWVTIGRSCTGIGRRWKVICALDIVTEFAMIALVIYLVFTLKTSVAKKIMVVSIFCLRLLIIVAIVFRINTFDRTGYTTNPFILEAPFIAWTQAQMCYALISATIPTFQNFLKQLNTGFGGIGAGEAGYGYGYDSSNGSRVRNKSNATAHATSRQRSMFRSQTGNDAEDQKEDMPTLTQSRTSDPSDRPSTATLPERSNSGTNGDARSITSNESRRMMIQKDVQWTIRSEAR